MSANKLSVVKIPNENKNALDNETKEHPRVPYMYLELLENKDKVRPEVVNKDYDPSDAVSLKSFSTNNNNKNVVKKKPSTIPKIEEEEEGDESEISVSEDENDDMTVDNKEDVVDDSDIDDNDGEEESELDDDDDDEESDQEISDQESLMNESENHYDTRDENETKNKLNAMLDDEYPRSSYQKQPPKLSDLQKSGVIQNQERTIPNIDMMEDDEEDDEDKKRELLFRFSLLKKSYNTQIDIPEFTIHSNYKRMVEVYENTLRHLSLESSVEQWKNILIGAFMCCEYVFGVWLNMDMAGYTQAQILNLAQYERLLIELGSKNYTPEAQNYPVEFRLIGMIILNAVIFIVSKLILKKTGNNIMNMMNQNVRNKYTESFENTTTNFFQQQQPMQEEKKKMKKPSFDFSSL